jgi:hypothetical protein
LVGRGSGSGLAGIGWERQGEVGIGLARTGEDQGVKWIGWEWTGAVWRGSAWLGEDQGKVGFGEIT